MLAISPRPEPLSNLGFRLPGHWATGGTGAHDHLTGDMLKPWGIRRAVRGSAAALPNADGGP